MAEALALVGLASAIFQFIDFGSKVVRQLRRLELDVADIPVVFRSVRTRLPLMLDLVNKIQREMEAGLIPDDSQERILPVLNNCVEQTTQLHSLLVRALPKPKESTWSRGKKAVVGVLIEPEVEKLNTELKANFDLLAQAKAIQDTPEPSSFKPASLPSFNVSGSTVHISLMPTDSQTKHTEEISYGEEEREEPSSRQSIFMVPFPRDINFIGRYSTLLEIEDMFQQQTYVALTGLGGIGKSQIAIEYCYVYKEKYPDAHVFWAYGSNSTRFEESYREIARRLAIPGWDDQSMDSMQLLHTWFEDESSGDWLLVVDNVDDASMLWGIKSDHPSKEGNASRAYARYLPSRTTGHVLLTTRDRRVGERLSTKLKPIVVTPLSAAESTELLQSKVSEELWCEDDAAKLVEELSHLPLAITQAAAFISENNLTVSEYLETLSASDEDVKDLLSEHLEDSRRDLDTENSVMRTWKLSYNQISRDHPRAAEILSSLAVLDYHGAPLMLLRKEKETEAKFRAALGALQAFSLITVGRGKNGIAKMHRLVALSTQKWLEVIGTLERWQSQVLKVLADNFPGSGQQQFADWALYEALTPHVLRVFSYEFTATDDLLQRAKLMIALTLYDLRKGNYQEAFEMCSESLEIRQKILPSHDPLTLESVQTLGETLLHRGELTAARTMLEKAAEGRKKSLGADNPDSLESLSDLTITLLDLDNVTKAEEIGEHVLTMRRQVLGEEDPDTLVSLNIVGILRHRQGNLPAAKETLEQVLQEREEILGVEHPDTLMTVNNLGKVYLDQGDLDAAEQMFKRAIAGEEQVLGAEGYDIQITLSNMALVYAAQGDFDGALKELRKVLAIREKRLGSEHPSTTFTMEMMVGILKQKGDAEEADKMAQMVGQRKLKQARKQYEPAGALLRAGLLFD